MTQEDKTIEQEIERISRMRLGERYKNVKAYWRLLNAGSPFDENEVDLPCENHMFLAIALRILDRLESIEKRLILPVRQQTDDNKIRILPLDCNLEHNKGE